METMFRSGRLLVSALCLLVGMSGTGFAPAQQLGRVNSDHVTIELPAERELVGRGLIGDLERCYVYMNRSIGGALPRRVTVTLDWGAAENRCNRRAGHITIGLGGPAPTPAARTASFTPAPGRWRAWGSSIFQKGRRGRTPSFSSRG
jgi:hypothetical protein